MLHKTTQSVLVFTDDGTLYLTEEPLNTSLEAITNVLKAWALRRNSYSIFLLLGPQFLCKWNICIQCFYHLLDKDILLYYTMNIVKHSALCSVMKKAVSLRMGNISRHIRSSWKREMVTDFILCHFIVLPRDKI